MKTLLFLLSLPLTAQTTVVTVPFTLPNTLIADALTWSRGQLSTNSAALTAGIGTSDTTFTISNASGYTASDLFSNSGATLLIDSEEITCTTLVGAVYSGCVRAQQSTTAATHATGSIVSLMKFATNSSLLKALIAPGLIAAAKSLPSSAYYSTFITSLTTAQTNLTGAEALGTIVK